MRWWLAVAVVFATSARLARADDGPRPEDVRKLYDDTLIQLKQAQDRKAELARENENLAARVAELEKQAQANQSRLDDLQHQVDGFSDRTYFLQSHYLLWQRFMDLNPLIMKAWSDYIAATAPLPMPMPAIIIQKP